MSDEVGGAMTHHIPLTESNIDAATVLIRDDLEKCAREDWDEATVTISVSGGAGEDA